MPELRIFLADDHALLRQGVKTLLQGQPGYVVVGEASTGLELIERARALEPDLAIVDVSMPDLGGARATRRLKAALPLLKIIALTMQEAGSYVHELLEAGATGYVLKRAANDELLQAIRAVAAGGVYLDPRVAGEFVALAHGAGAAVDRPRVALSARETAVLRLIARGYTNKEVAADLELSIKTVETYRARSMEKLALRGRIDIVRFATDRGWLQAG